MVEYWNAGMLECWNTGCKGHGPSDPASHFTPHTSHLPGNALPRHYERRCRAEQSQFALGQAARSRLASCAKQSQIWVGWDIWADFSAACEPIRPESGRYKQSQFTLPGSGVRGTPCASGHVPNKANLSCRTDGVQCTPYEGGQTNPIRGPGAPGFRIAEQTPNV
jgi:hypothetical protein